MQLMLFLFEHLLELNILVRLLPFQCQKRNQQSNWHGDFIFEGAEEFQDYDEFIFGSSQLDNGLLSVPADSVLILEKTGTEAEENPDDNQTIEENNSTQENDSTDVNETGNAESNNTVDENQMEEELRVCDGCCGETFELPTTEQCPIVSCEECEELQADVESKSSSSEIVRNLLVIIVVISLLAFIQMNRRSDDNH